MIPRPFIINCAPVDKSCSPKTIPNEPYKIDNKAAVFVFHPDILNTFIELKRRQTLAFSGAVAIRMPNTPGGDTRRYRH